MTNSRNTDYSTSSPIAMRRGKRTNSPVEDKSEENNNSTLGKSTNKPTKWVQIRLIPIWLRIVIVLVLLFVAAIVGLTVGYSVLGDGESSDVLKWATWQHIIDIIKGKE